jgi:release factor glutamine methyltransferase
MAYYFRDLRLETWEDKVYVPAEDSELLAGSLGEPTGAVLDVGTGTGIQALTAAKTARSVLGVDANPAAVELAALNAKANGIDNASFKVSDLFSEVEGKFDLIIFNAPYLDVQEEGELERAWSGGCLGAEVINRFIDGAATHLAAGGRVLILVSAVNRLDEVLGRLSLRGLAPEVVAIRRVFFEELYVVSGVFKGKRQNIKHVKNHHGNGHNANVGCKRVR